MKYALIGSGNIGSKHLLSLKKIDRPIRISVVDNSTKSINYSKKIFVIMMILVTYLKIQTMYFI